MILIFMQAEVDNNQPLKYLKFHLSQIMAGCVIHIMVENLLLIFIMRQLKNLVWETHHYENIFKLTSASWLNMLKLFNHAKSFESKHF